MDNDFTPTNPVKNFLSNKRNVVIIGGVIGVIVVYVIYMGISRQQANAPWQSITNENQVPTTEEVQPEYVNPTQSPEVIAAVEQQKQADVEYANWQSTVREEYPWKKYLPLHTDKHYVYFDLEKKKFIGFLYPTATDGVEKMKADILAELQGKDEPVPTSSYPFEWTIIPE